MDQFENLNATHLYCPKCREATPVRERLLLVLPDGDLSEYICSKCGTSIGKRKTRAGLAARPHPAPRGRPRYI